MAHRALQLIRPIPEPGCPVCEGDRLAIRAVDGTWVEGLCPACGPARIPVLDLPWRHEEPRSES